MQKLFSMFPRGAPGLALLLLRLFVGAVLIFDAAAAAPALNEVLVYALAACGLALIVGCITPIVAVVSAIIVTMGLTADSTLLALHSFAPIVIAVALALLGPGAYSLDARIFGRRLLEFRPDASDDSLD
ncbi:MAG TPA: hypothetical protein VGQ22_11330 [Steroidobacteraceae bacterium]|jgi:hypothetical protein|nr:hypothetical protein [Steroidobacteraceae bacterium]